MYSLSRLLLLLAVVAICYSIAALVAMYWPQSLWVLLLVGVVLVKRRRGQVPHLTTLGDASFASQGQLRRAGMLNANSGLVLGHLTSDDEKPQKIAAINNLFYWHVGAQEACSELVAAFLKKRGRGPLVRLPQAVHSAVFAPSGAGKNVSIVFPFLFRCADSCVILDPKGENAKITAEYRRRVFGHRIIFLDPYKVYTQTPDSLNPLSFIDKDDPQAIDDCNELGNALIVRDPNEREKHWSDSAEMWAAALIAVVALFGDDKEGTRSLQTVRDILTDQTKLQMAIKLMVESTVCGGMLARMGGVLTHYIEKERASTLTTLSRNFRFLDSLAIAASTRTSTFDPAALRSGRLTIYLILPLNRMKTGSALLRMWLVALLRGVVSGGLQERNKVHFLLDEAACLSHLDVIDEAVDRYRSYGVRLIFIYQSLAQLRRTFPDGQDQTFLGQVAQIFFGVNDVGLPGGVGTGDYISNRIGDRTVAVRSGGSSLGKTVQWGRSGGQENSGGSRSWNSSENWTESARKLLQAPEVVGLSPRMAITFAPNVPPVLTRLTRYYEEPLEIRPGPSRQPALAFKTFAFAAIVLAVSLALAVWVTQRYSEFEAERRAAAEQQHGGVENYWPGIGAQNHIPSQENP